MNNHPIFKKVDSVTVDEVLAAFGHGNNKDVPDYAHLMTMNEFIDSVDEHVFTDYDGAGTLVIDGKTNDAALAFIDWGSVLIANELIVPFTVLKELFGDRVQVAWYNR